MKTDIDCPGGAVHSGRIGPTYIGANDVARWTHKQRVFVEEYLVCWNAAEAARRAGYSSKGARQLGAKNLTKPHIAAAIERRLKEKTMSADEVLVRLTEQGRNEGAEYVLQDGTVDLARLLTDGKDHLIKGTKWDRQGNLVVEFYDAQAALVHIGKYHKLFTDKHEHSGPNGKPIPISRQDAVAVLQDADRAMRDDAE